MSAVVTCCCVPEGTCSLKQHCAKATHRTLALPGTWVSEPWQAERLSISHGQAYWHGAQPCAQLEHTWGRPIVLHRRIGSGLTLHRAYHHGQSQGQGLLRAVPTGSSALNDEGSGSGKAGASWFGSRDAPATAIAVAAEPSNSADAARNGQLNQRPQQPRGVAGALRRLVGRTRARQVAHSSTQHVRHEQADVEMGLGGVATVEGRPQC